MDPLSIEAQIRELLTTETNYWTLSDKLFGPSGLFGLLGPTVEDRKRIGKSLLFKEAQKRIREIEHLQAVLLREEVRKMPLRIDRAKGT